MTTIFQCLDVEKSRRFFFGHLVLCPAIRIFNLIESQTFYFLLSVLVPIGMVNSLCLKISRPQSFLSQQLVDSPTEDLIPLVP